MQTSLPAPSIDVTDLQRQYDIAKGDRNVADANARIWAREHTTCSLRRQFVAMANAQRRFDEWIEHRREAQARMDTLEAEITRALRGKVS